MNKELVDWYEVLCLIHSSRPQTPVDAIVVHSRSHGRDGDGLLELVGECIPRLESVVVINGGDGKSLKDPNHKAWPGKEEYLQRLAELGISREKIILSESASHTREESEMFARAIKEKGWNRVAVANHGHCLLRAMLGWLSEIEKLKLTVKLFPVAPTSLNWRIQVHGQQGSKPAQRLIQCRGELERILQYQTQYPDKFVSVETLVQYLADINRD